MRENDSAYCLQHDHGRALISCEALVRGMITRDKNANPLLLKKIQMDLRRRLSITTSAGADQRRYAKIGHLSNRKIVRLTNAEAERVCYTVEENANRDDSAPGPGKFRTSIESESALATRPSW